MNEAELSERGMWPWFAQRITGALLIILAGIHFFFTHFGIEGFITFESIAQRVRVPFWFGFDLILLALAIFHGLNGVRAVILDYRPGSRGERGLTFVLWVAGVVSFVVGVWFLAPYGRPA